MKIDMNMVSPQLAQESAASAKEISLEKSFDRTLKAALQTEDEKKLYESCQQLESVFVNKVLQTMRASIPHSDFINRSFATEAYESMLFEEYSKNISQTDSLGIADIMYRQLSSGINKG